MSHCYFYEFFWYCLVFSTMNKYQKVQEQHQNIDFIPYIINRVSMGIWVKAINQLCPCVSPCASSSGASLWLPTVPTRVDGSNAEIEFPCDMKIWPMTIKADCRYITLCCTITYLFILSLHSSFLWLALLKKQLSRWHLLIRILNEHRQKKNPHMRSTTNLN